MQAEAILSAITKLVVEQITSHEQKNAEVSTIPAVMNMTILLGTVGHS